MAMIRRRQSRPFDWGVQGDVAVALVPDVDGIAAGQLDRRETTPGSAPQTDSARLGAPRTRRPLSADGASRFGMARGPVPARAATALVCLLAFSIGWSVRGAQAQPRSDGGDCLSQSRPGTAERLAPPAGGRNAVVSTTSKDTERSCSGGLR